LHVHYPRTNLGARLKLLLTSGGVTNTSIHSALVQLLNKPIAQCHALVVPTAQWGHPACGPASVQRLVAAESGFRHLSGLGWALARRPRTHRTAQHRRGPLDPSASGDRRAPCRWR
jgi:hypothetical protein